MPLDPGVVESVINSNFKVLGETMSVGLAQANSLAALNATSHQQMINAIRELAIMEAAGQRAGIDLAESVAGKKMSEADLSRTLAELTAVVAQAMQSLKGAQTTRPETG
jgi:hypothetical protein